MLTPEGNVVDDYPKYAGMDRFEARKAIVKELEREWSTCKSRKFKA